MLLNETITIIKVVPHANRVGTTKVIFANAFEKISQILLTLCRVHSAAT